MVHLTMEAQAAVLIVLAIIAGAIGVAFASKIRNACLRFLIGWVATIIASALLALVFAVAVDGFSPPPTPPGAMGAALLVSGAVFPIGPVAALLALLRSNLQSAH